MATDIGTGSTVTFGTSAFTADIIGINLSGVTRETVNTSHMATTSAHTFMLVDLVDNGELSLEVAYVASLVPPILTNAPMETCTIVWAGHATTWSFSCGNTGFDAGAPLEDKMTGTLTFKISGAITRS